MPFAHILSVCMVDTASLPCMYVHITLQMLFMSFSAHMVDYLPEHVSGSEFNLHCATQLFMEP